MRKSTKFLGALAVAGLVAAGGSAFTTSITLPATVAGYGQVVTTGATVTTIDVTPVTADPSKLAEVVFTTSSDLSGKTGTMTLRLGAAVVGTPYSCVLASPLTAVFTCTIATANPAFATFDTIGLTVV